MSAAPVKTRLARALELQRLNEARAQQEEAGELRKAAILRRRATAVRNSLLGRLGTGVDAFSVMDPVGMADAALEHMANLQESGGTLEQGAEDSAILSAVLSYATAQAGQLGDAQAVSRADFARRAIAVQLPASQFNEHQLNRYKAQAVATTDERLREAMEDAAEHMDAAKIAANKAYQEKMASAQKSAVEARDFAVQQVRAEQISSSVYYEKLQEIRENYDKLCDDIKGAYHDAMEAGRQAYSGIGGAVRDSVLEASSMSQQEAEAWANSQEITKAAISRLKKLGYPVEDVRRDMAEFARLTSGRLRKVVIASNGSKRANATGIHGHGSAVINLGSRFDKRVLFHEFGHHLEADPSILAAARGFLARRADGSGLHSMARLTGNKAYRPNEQAYRDNFFDHYVGKFYKDATEVMSMGLESFSNPGMLGERMHKDPEMFAMIEGILRSKENPLVKLIHDIRAEKAEAEKEGEEGEEAIKDSSMKALASAVNMTVTGDPTEMKASPEALENFLSVYTRYYGLTKFMGFVPHPAGEEVFAVWAGNKIKALKVEGGGFKWSRPQKGLVVVLMLSAVGAGRGRPAKARDYKILGGDMEEAKAAIQLWTQTGKPPDNRMSTSELKQHAQSAQQPQQ
jgi:hypothetical protein